jgi:hypothetical protein
LEEKNSKKIPKLKFQLLGFWNFTRVGEMWRFLSSKIYVEIAMVLSRKSAFTFTGSFDFKALASKFEYVFIENIPQFNLKSLNEAGRFVTLIDQLYNFRVKLCCTCAVPLNEIFNWNQFQELDQKMHIAEDLFKKESGLNWDRQGVNGLKFHLNVRLEDHCGILMKTMNGIL